MTTWYSLLKEAKPHKYSCVMARVPDPLRQSIIDWGKENISDDCLEDDGREDKPHVTVLYGLHTAEADDVREAIESFESFEVELGEVKSLVNHEGAEVIYISGESSDLRKMNKKLKEFPYTNTYDDYKIHFTVAYTNRDSCSDLVGDKSFVGKKFTVNKVEFSSKNETKTNISLS